MKKILIGAPVRQKEHIFIEYLDRLRKLRKPRGYEVQMHFIFNNCDFKHLLKDNETYEYYNTTDTYNTTGKTHEWKHNNFSNVINMKNRLLEKTIKDKYDYFFLVDSDLLLHKDTLKLLLHYDRKIIAEVFYTKWNEDDEKAKPNAWDFDFYSYKSKMSLYRLYKKGLFKVGYSGACILIHKDVIRAGVSYTPINNISWSIWEDRAFCIRASLAGFDIFLDTNLPAEHLYRQSDYDKNKDVYK